MRTEPVSSMAVTSLPRSAESDDRATLLAGRVAGRAGPSSLGGYPRVGSVTRADPHLFTIPTAAAEAPGSAGSLPSRVIAEDAVDRAIAAVSAAPLVPLSLGGRVRGTPPAIRAGQVLALSWVPLEEIPADYRAAVERHLRSAATAAGLSGEVLFRFYRPTANGAGDFAFPAERDNEIPAGCTPLRLPNTIGLLAGLEGDLLPFTIAHECRHLRQQQLAELLADEEWCERDAHEFASRYIRSETP